MNALVDATPIEGVRQLLHFRIHKTSQGGQHEQIALFRNGRQQCPIKVAIIPADASGNVVSLTDEEVYGALGLVRYDDGDAIGGGVTFGKTKNKFEWDENIISKSGRILREPAKDRDQRASRPTATVTPTAPSIYTLYVTATAAAQDVDLAASFKVPNYTTFVTNSDADDPDGNGEDGLFNSSVQLLLVDSPQLQPEDYGAATDGVLAGRKVGDFSRYTFWATEYYLDLEFNGRKLKLDSVGSEVSETEASGGTKEWSAKEWSANGEFGLYTSGDSFSSVQWGISYFGTPGSTAASGQSVGDLDHIDVTKLRSAAPERSRSCDVTTHVSTDDYVESVTTTVQFGRSASASTRGATPLASSKPEDMYKTCCKDGIAGANANRVVIGLLKGNLPATFRDKNGTKLPGAMSTTFHILDKYGNDHALSLAYDIYADKLTIA